MADTNLVVKEPDQLALIGPADRALREAQDIVVDSPEMYEICATNLAQVKGFIKKSEEERTALVSPLNAVITRLNNLFRGPRETYEETERVYKRKMLGFQEDQERKRQEEAARIRRIEEERQAQERRRIEEQRRADEERARLETQRLETERQAALEAGDTVKAAKIDAKIEMVAEVVEIKNEAAQDLTSLVSAAPVAQGVPEVPKVKGVSTKTVWKTRITNKAEAQKFCADNPMFANLFVFDDKAANKLAGALKENMVIPGLEVFEEKIISSRAA